MNERRHLLRMLVGAPCVFATFGWARQATVRRIGTLTNSPPTTPDSARLSRVFHQALEEHGFVEGRNVVYERRYVEGRIERIPAFAAELVQLDCEVIVVTAGDLAIRTLKERTSRIPIVMAGASDPVRDGLIASLARPGGNVTGIASASLDLFPKQLELLKAAAPGVRRVVNLYAQTGAGDDKSYAELRRNRDAAAKALGIELIRIEMATPQDFGSATAAALRERADALLISPNGINFILRHEIGDFALRHRLPAVAQNPEYAAAGLLISYGNNTTWLFRTTATYEVLSSPCSASTRSSGERLGTLGSSCPAPARRQAPLRLMRLSRGSTSTATGRGKK